MLGIATLWSSLLTTVLVYLIFGYIDNAFLGTAMIWPAITAGVIAAVVDLIIPRAQVDFNPFNALFGQRN